MSQLIETSMKPNNWIVEGVFGSLVESYLPESDMLIWLNIDWATCKDRLLLRGSESHSHMGREQSELGLMKLISWASTYSSRLDDCSFHGHQDLFLKFNGLRFCFNNENSVAAFLEESSFHNVIALEYSQ